MHPPSQVSFKGLSTSGRSHSSPFTSRSISVWLLKLIIFYFLWTPWTERTVHLLAPKHRRRAGEDPTTATTVILLDSTFPYIMHQTSSRFHNKDQGAATLGCSQRPSVPVYRSGGGAKASISPSLMSSICLLPLSCFLYSIKNILPYPNLMSSIYIKCTTVA